MIEPQDLEIFWKASEEVEQNYREEVEKNKKLHEEVSAARAQIQALESLLEKEKSLGAQREAESRALQKQVEILLTRVERMRLEFEKLKTVHPIEDLLKAKEIEVDRLKKAFGSVSSEHEHFGEIQAWVQAHEAQRDELKKLLDAAQRRLEGQSQWFKKTDLGDDSELAQNSGKNQNSLEGEEGSEASKTGAASTTPVPEF